MSCLDHNFYLRCKIFILLHLLKPIKSHMSESKFDVLGIFYLLSLELLRILLKG